MLKTFRKTLDDGFFPFIILDAINEKVKYFDQFWSAAKTKGFEVRWLSLTIFTDVFLTLKMFAAVCFTNCFICHLPQVYVAEVSADHQTCVKRNIHGRKLKDITKVLNYTLYSFCSWEGMWRACGCFSVKIRLYEENKEKIENKDVKGFHSIHR